MTTAIQSQDTQTEDPLAAIVPHLKQLERALKAVAQPQLEVSVKTEASKEMDTLLMRQAQAIEQTLIPMVLNSTKNMETTRNISRPLTELLELLKLKLMTNNSQVEAED